jgi:hypothetical protein
MSIHSSMEMKLENVRKIAQPEAEKNANELAM